MTVPGHSRTAVISGHRPLKAVYITTLVFAALTGFGQMPIYKRYYFSDIPGLGWLANFYTTRYIHYISAAVLLTVVAYALCDYLLLKRRQLKLTASGYLRAALLGGIAATGVLFVIKNFPIFVFPANVIIALNLCHLSFVMLFLLVNLFCLIARKRWTTATSAVYKPE
jgi:hypothetical protein